MAKGENIFKRKDGRWEARYIKSREFSGKIRYGYCYGRTYKEAKEKVIKAKAALILGRPVPKANTKYRFAYFCDEWLKSCKVKLKESTCVKYSIALEKHVKPRLGNCYPLAFNSSLIEAFTKELLFDEALAPKTVRDILVVLRSVLNHASKQFPGTFSQVDFCYPKDKKKEMRVLSENEQKRFICHLLSNMDECRFGILLALVTGMRIGEVCALKWENISLKDRTIKITSTMQRLADMDAKENMKTKIVFGSPKSDASSRMIPMNNDAITLCERIKPQRPSDFVLTGTSGFMEPRVLQYRMKRYTGECGLENVHFHTLRHTFATRCVEAGFEIKSLSEILGHSSTTITLDRYIHSSMNLKRRNMNKLAMLGC